MQAMHACMQLVALVINDVLLVARLVFNLKARLPV